MKKIISLFTLLFFLSCANYTKPTSEPFVIKGATFNNWMGGQPGASGTRIIVLYQAKEEVDFKRIYFQNSSAKVEYKNENDKTYLYAFINTSNREEITINPKGLIKEQKKKNAITFPFKLKKNQIAISYSVNNEIRYFLIEDAIQTKTDYYP